MLNAVRLRDARRKSEHKALNADEGSVNGTSRGQFEYLRTFVNA